jgi:hypothetical protein
MLAIGKIINNKAGEFISGSNPKAKESISEIDIKAIGKKEFEMDLESSITQMAQNTKAIGRRT